MQFTQFLSYLMISQEYYRSTGVMRLIEKMLTSITIIGTSGKIISDSTEMKVYFKEDNFPSGYTKGWNIKYVTDLTKQVDFYLRGEEYSAQVDYFIKTLLGKVPNSINTFKSALLTDKAISIIRNNSKQYIK